MSDATQSVKSFERGIAPSVANGYKCLMSNVVADSSGVPEWTLGDRLAKARRHAGVSRAAMAAYLGISPSAISTYEVDTREPKLQTLRLWAVRTGVPLPWLVDGDLPPAGQMDAPSTKCYGLAA